MVQNCGGNLLSQIEGLSSLRYVKTSVDDLVFLERYYFSLLTVTGDPKMKFLRALAPGRT